MNHPEAEEQAREILRLNTRKAELEHEMREVVQKIEDLKPIGVCAELVDAVGPWPSDFRTVGLTVVHEKHGRFYVAGFCYRGGKAGDRRQASVVMTPDFEEARALATNYLRNKHEHEPALSGSVVGLPVGSPRYGAVIIMLPPELDHRVAFALEIARAMERHASNESEPLLFELYKTILGRGGPPKTAGTVSEDGPPPAAAPGA